jgi:thiamine pyrophosphate-dependent acetolactate synthase large subunit-like protein
MVHYAFTLTRQAAGAHSSGLHLWMARHLYSFRARQILISNGQQTLGVALPWGIAATLVRPNEKVLSISGDGGFLFSAMELETAVRLRIVFLDALVVKMREQGTVQNRAVYVASASTWKAKKKYWGCGRAAMRAPSFG